MTDLDKLIAAVEAGHAVCDFRPLYSVPRPGQDWMDLKWYAVKAHHGSLDAAHRLHEALLPGWTPGLQMQDDTRWFCELREGHCTSYDRVEVSIAHNPARAWLLAILRALKAKGDA